MTGRVPLCSPARAAGIAGAVLLVGAAASAQAPGPSPPDGPRATVWQAPLASLVVPGAGQFLLGHDRGVAYLAAEAFAILQYLRATNLARAQGDRFRDLAFAVARQPFAPVARDTVFEYFEQMSRFAASGAFDADPGPGFAPEADAGTYNGSVWLLARRTYWPDPNTPPVPTSPEYQRAVQFYMERAVGPGFAWTWRNAPLERESFRQAIRRSDGAYRDAQGYLGLLLANHALSAVDALISSRLSQAVGRPARVTTRLGRAGGKLAVRIPL